MSALPEGWAVARVEDFARPEPGSMTDGPYGSNLKTSHYTADGPLVVRLGNIKPGLLDMSDDAHVSSEHFAGFERHHLEPGDIVIAALGDPIGRAARVPSGIGPAMVKADCFRLRPSDQVEAQYLIKWLNSEEARASFLKVSHGMGRIRVNLSDVRNAEIPLPPLPEQRRIVAKLDRLSARTKAARAHLARVQSLASRAKQATLAAAFEKVGESAEIKTVAELACHFTSGSRDWAKYYDKGDAVFVLAGNIRPLSFDPTPKRFVDPPRNSADALRTKVERDDLLVTIVGANTGDLCRVPHDFEAYYVCQSVALIRLHEAWRSRFVELFLTTQMGEGGQLQEAIYGQGRPHLSFKDLKAVAVPELNRRETESFVRRIEAAFARIDRMVEDATRAAHLLDRLDQRLLAKAFRGELVPQDPNDEPAAELLARIKATRANAPKSKRGRRQRA